MGTLVSFQPTKSSILRGARREMERIYRLSGGGQDPILSDESRELFDLGLVEEVSWQDWETYCRHFTNRRFEGEWSRPYFWFTE
jgi:hypothetical protein